jgi:hypothetical protein
MPSLREKYLVNNGEFMGCIFYCIHNRGISILYEGPAPGRRPPPLQSQVFKYRQYAVQYGCVKYIISSTGYHVFLRVRTGEESLRSTFTPQPHGQRPPPSSSGHSASCVSVRTRMPSMDATASSTVISETKGRAPTPPSAETPSRASFDTSTTVGVAGIPGPAIAPGVFCNVALPMPLSAHRENVDTEGAVEERTNSVDNAVDVAAGSASVRASANRWARALHHMLVLSCCAHNILCPTYCPNGTK